MRTWREAHRVVVELEQLHEGSRALLGALGSGARTGATPPPPHPAGEEGDRKRRRGRGSRTENRSASRGRRGEDPAVKPGSFVAAMPPHLRQICYRMRDNGVCDRENCTFDHDPRRIKEAKQHAQREASQRGGGGGGGGGGRADPKAPSGGGSKTEVCQNFLRGKCNKGDSCKFSHSSRVIARLSKAVAAFQSLNAPPEAPRNGGTPGANAAAPGPEPAAAPSGKPPCSGLGEAGHGRSGR